MESVGIVYPDSLAKSRYEEVVKTKEQARIEWMAKVNIPPPDCKNPQSTLKSQECQNLLNVANQAFEKQWQQSQVNKPN